MDHLICEAASGNQLEFTTARLFLASQLIRPLPREIENAGRCEQRSDQRPAICPFQPAREDKRYRQRSSRQYRERRIGAQEPDVARKQQHPRDCPDKPP